MGISQGVDSVRTGVCTSTTRPASPYVGQMIFETDTNYIKIYTASGWSTGMRQSTSFVASYLIVAGGGGGGGGAFFFASATPATSNADRAATCNVDLKLNRIIRTIS